MPSSKTASKPRFGEFVALMALMTSLVAMSIDAMLPALSAIGADLGVERDNANQLVVTLIFLGLAMGQLLYGPLSDSVGRKPAIYLGYGVFIAGSLLSIFAIGFPMMLAGPLGMAIGQAYNGTVTPLVVGFTLLGLSALALMRWAEGTHRPSPQDLQPAA